jgi:hypothetical protein
MYNPTIAPYNTSLHCRNRRDMFITNDRANNNRKTNNRRTSISLFTISLPHKAVR